MACSRLSVSEHDFQSSALTDLERLEQATEHVELISSKLKMLDFEDYVPGFLSWQYVQYYLFRNIFAFLHYKDEESEAVFELKRK